MNAAIRAVVRASLYHKLEVYGIRKGYKGMIEGDMGTPVISFVSVSGIRLWVSQTKAEVILLDPN